MDNNLSDLIRDYKLCTRFEKPHTIHLFNDPDAPPSSPQRLEQWKKNRTLGHGGQGRVVLQTCTRGSRGYAQRAVKMIPLKEGGRREYLRELEAIIKFSHDKVRLSISPLRVSAADISWAVCQALCKDNGILHLKARSLHCHGVFPQGRLRDLCS